MRYIVQDSCWMSMEGTNRELQQRFSKPWQRTSTWIKTNASRISLHQLHSFASTVTYSARSLCGASMPIQTAQYLLYLPMMKLEGCKCAKVMMNGLMSNLFPTR